MSMGVCVCRFIGALAGELGIFYQDLYNLVRPLHEVDLLYSTASTLWTPNLA